MKRREYLFTLPPLITLGAGCNIIGGSSERDLWSISVESVTALSIDFSAEVVRRLATTAHPATIRLRFENTTAEPITLAQIDRAKPSDIAPDDPGLILIPEDQDLDRESEECWQPASNPTAASDATLSTWDVPAGDSWSIVHGVWVDEAADCIPNGIFDFKGSVDVQETGNKVGWELEVRASPAE